MSVWPVASHTQTPFGTGTIGAPERRARWEARPHRHRYRREPAFHHRDQSRSALSSSLQIGPNVAALLPALSGCAAVHGAAHQSGTKPGAAGPPSSFPLASRRQAKIRLGSFPCLCATSDTFVSATDVSATILVLSSVDQWRRCFPFAKTSTRIDPLTSSLDQGHMLRQSRESNNAVLTKGTPCCGFLERFSAWPFAVYEGDESCPARLRFFSNRAQLRPSAGHQHGLQTSQRITVFRTCG